jgi:Domain of unknown function (DUF4352)
MKLFPHVATSTIKKNLQEKCFQHYYVQSLFRFFSVLFFIIWICACNTQNSSSQKQEAQQSPIQPAKESFELKINFKQEGGPFLIIGPNPGGVWAPHKDNGFWWNEMDITIENNCDKAVYIDPVNFILYVSSQPDIKNAQFYSATTSGKEFQTNPLTAKLIQPGTQVTGKLIFEVPELLPDGTASNGAYKIIRLATDQSYGNCTAIYMPY